MTLNINTNVFTIIEDGEFSYLDLTMEFDELAQAMYTVLKKWDEVQKRHLAMLTADADKAKTLKAMAETMVTCCDRALDNSEKCYKRVLK